MDKPGILEITIIALLGGLLGVFFMIPLRNALIVKEHGVLPTVTETVTIAQGVDDKSNADYRDQNQLVILGFPFDASSMSEYIEIPVFTPADLLEARPNYYAKGMNLI